MPENVMFTIVDNGYDISEVNKYIADNESLEKRLEELTELNDRILKERDELFNNCVAFAKKIKILEKQLEEKNNLSAQYEALSPYLQLPDEEATLDKELPPNTTNFDELFNLLNGIENETSCYVKNFKSSMENVINRVMEKAKSILTNANAEKEKIIEKASNDAEKIINENKAVKMKLETAYKQLGEILIDLNTLAFKNEN